MDAATSVPSFQERYMRQAVVQISGLNTQTTTEEVVYIFREGNDAPRAYQRFPPEAEQRSPTLRPKLIRWGGQVIGRKIICIGLDRDTTNPQQHEVVFRRPSHNEDAQLYCIKEFDTRTFDPNNVGFYHPYNQLHVAHQLGDNIHVLGCIEILRDDQLVYGITQFCPNGDLINAIIPSYQAHCSEDTARHYFRQLLECLIYLQSKEICHGKLDPENITLLNDKCIITTLGLCLRVTHAQDGHPLPLTTDEDAVIGDPAYMAPEVFANAPNFDGYSADLYSIAPILYNLLTGLKLYHIPRETDFSYNLFVVHTGLSNDTMNENIIHAMDNSHASEVLQRARAHSRLSGDVKNLLQNMLRRDPAARMNLDQILNHPWLNQR